MDYEYSWQGGDPYLKIGEANTQASKGSSAYVWALRDINLEVKQGEILGIIGKNGAGKSTLLKILSRVTKPTTGSITYKGRIASLLEVGTGVHPEMTGRENIYMNGTIMGMTRAEINQRLNEIIDFAGVERYIDTPVKRYLSGMKVRLGFAIVAHLEPEILVVDEVLAVGDAEFQKKAIGKMQDVSTGEGRTVLFVSHNMASIRILCNSGMLLLEGKSKYFGKVQEAINLYLHTEESNEITDFFFPNDFEKPIFIKQAYLSIRDNKSNTYINREKFLVYITVEANEDVVFSFEVLIKDQNYNPIIFCPVGLISDQKEAVKKNEEKSYKISLSLPFLASGCYYLDLMLVESGRRFFHYAENALPFNVQSNFISKTGWNFRQDRGQGSVLLNDFEIL